MGKVTDIRSYKSALRSKYSEKRSHLSVTEKADLDERILQKVLMLNQYHSAKTLLTYVSKDREVDTRKLIQTALEQGKKVAVPCCVPGTRIMKFYYIHSPDELSVKSFGVLEPEMNEERLFQPEEHSICVVPAICFDTDGYRLGYGKGYYDRFLADYAGVTIGLCYSQCVRGHLIHGRYDCAVDLLVTERFIRRTARKN